MCVSVYVCASVCVLRSPLHPLFQGTPVCMCMCVYVCVSVSQASDTSRSTCVYVYECLYASVSVNLCMCVCECICVSRMCSICYLKGKAESGCSGVTVVLQWCYSGVTVVLQCQCSMVLCCAVCDNQADAAPHHRRSQM
jgi:hypothetical protein